MNKPLFLIVPALLAVLLPSAARADDAAAALLAKHKSFMGWQFGDGSIRSVSIDGEIVKTSDSTVSTKVHQVQLGTAFRTTSTDKDGDQDEGFTGNIFWSSNMNGFTRAIRGDLTKVLVSEQILFNEFFTLLPATATKSDTVDGKTCTILHIEPAAGFPIDACVNPETGEMFKATIDRGGEFERAIVFQEYREIMPGKKMVSKWKFQDSNYFHRNTKIVPNAVVTADNLHPPAQRASWKFSNQQPFSIEFLDKDNSPRIIVEARVNGVAGRFILDTGASSIALSKEFAGKVHAKAVRSETFSGVNGELNGQIAKIDTVEIGGNTLSNVLVSTGIEQVEKDAPDGLMGFDLLAGAIVNVDLDNKQMTILDPKTHQVNKDAGITVAADLSAGIPYIPMKISGRVPVNALLDSGGGNLVLFSTKLLTDKGVVMLVDDSTLGSHLDIGGVAAGYASGECGHLDSISVGPVVYQHAPACSLHGWDENEIIVGLDFLKGFNMLFDYPESYIIFTPRS